MARDAEVIVVGGGLAGSATALAFAAAGHEVLVLERASFPRPKVCGEGLLPHGVAALRRLGLEPPPGARPFRGIRFSSRQWAATGRFPDGERGLGLRRTELDGAALAAAIAHPRIEVRERTLVRGLRRDGVDQVVLTADGELRAPLVVGADGLHSRVRGWAGLDGPRRGRRRYGVRAHYALRAGVADPEWVDVFRMDGAELYVTPVGPAEVNVAALCEHPTMRTFSGDAPGGLRRLVTSCPALAERLAGADPLDEVLVCGPLRRAARAAATDGVLLVGDAAGFLDGITGEGMSIALRSAEIAAEVGSAALRGGGPSRLALQPYARRRARLVRDVELLGKIVLFGVRSRALTELALRLLSSRPELFDRLLAVETGHATLLSVLGGAPAPTSA
jgi:menaquinone-9 beta-reductase